MLPPSRWRAALLRGGAVAWDIEKFVRSIFVFIIVGVSIGALRKNILPKSLHPVSRVISFIPEKVLAQIDPSVGDDTPPYVPRGRRKNRKKSENIFFNIFQILFLIFIARLMVKFLVYRATSFVIMVLFDSTRFTYDLVIRIANFCIKFPLAVLVILPIVRRTAWYYLLAYFTICGGSCFVLIFTISSSVMIVWRNLVVTTRDDNPKNIF